MQSGRKNIAFIGVASKGSPEFFERYKGCCSAVKAAGLEVSENLQFDLQPDWIFYFAVGMLALFAWIKLIYTRFTLDILGSTINYQLSLRLYNNANVVQRRVSLLVLVFYFLNLSLYLLLVFEYFE